MSDVANSKKRFALVAILLAVITFVLYLPVKDAKFMIYDDNQYVTENTNVTSGLTFHGAIWAFTSSAAANYHPLTWIAHQADCQMFGLNPRWHHLMNVFVHCIDCVLLLVMLVKLTGSYWRSAVVAAMFAWHPMHVESVAWIAERKDTLCAMFWILTVIAYSSYAKKRSILKYLLVLALFVLALLAKPMAVTLPFVLLLLDYWPLNRIQAGNSTPAATSEQLPFGKLVWEKIPLIILSLLNSVVTYVVQKDFGSMATLHPPLQVRLMNAVIAYVKYIGKLVWPQKLAIFYPYVDEPSVMTFAICVFVLVAIWFAVIGNVFTRKYCFVGWAWFLGVLVPAIGLVQVGEQSMADRYTYIPGVGLFIVVVWLVADYLVLKPSLKMPVIGFTILLLACYLFRSHSQITYWVDAEKLFSHGLEAAGESATGEYNLAFIYHDMGRDKEAVDHYAKSIELDPTQFVAHNNRGASLARLGRHEEATNEFQKALDKAPGLWNAHENYAASLLMLGDKDGALFQYQEAVRVKPDRAGTHFNLGTYYIKLGQFANAKTELLAAEELDPSQPDIHRNLASVLSSLGDKSGATAEYEATLKLNPDDLFALNDLAWLRAACAEATIRNGAEAVRLAKHANELTHYTQPIIIGTLANAYAEAGQFDDAVATAQKAIAKATETKMPQVADKNRELMELYKSHQAFHEN